MASPIRLPAPLLKGCVLLPENVHGANNAPFGIGRKPQALIEKTAYRGFGPHCPPGFTWTCGYYGRCWCRPCR